MKWQAMLLAAIGLFFPAACETGSAAAGGDADARRLVVASWNLEAFFDAEQTGTEYDEYKSSAGWTETKYLARMERVGAAVAALAKNGPDVLAVQEIENAATLEALASGPLAAFGYRWTAFAGETGGALGIGLLSRYPLSNVRVHSIGSPGYEVPRPILEARLEAGGSPLEIFVCHWKSKLGGEEETEVLRRASAASLARRFVELSLSDPAAGAMALGDLNENVDEFQRVGRRYPTALLPDRRDAAGLVSRYASARESGSLPLLGGKLLVVSSAKPPVSVEIKDAVAVYSPWYDAAWQGSYHYQNAWETIDHALIAASLFDGAGWEYSSFSVIDLPPFADASGYPQGYDPRTGVGLSDHLPIVVQLERR
jgi:endonuclease/exonuclease/phosphatase family metal-dependent hydrolase